MAQAFRYRAWDRSGKEVTGTIQAERAESVAERLRVEGFFLASLQPIKEKSSRLSRPRSMAPKEVAIFCRQFAIMVETGMPVVDSLKALADQQPVKATKETVLSVVKHVVTGESLAESFRRHDKVFPQMFINMIELGEESGNLSEVLNRLATFYEKEAKLRGDIKQALTYPTVVTLFAFIAIGVVLFAVLPTFANLFQEYDADLPLLTRVILGVQGWMMSNILYVLLGLVLLVGLTRLYVRNSRGRRQVDWLFLRLPIAGELVQKVIFSRFSRTLSLLITSGIGMVHALEILEKIVGNTVVATDVATARVGVEHGRGVSEPLREGKVFPRMLVDVIAVGEETGGMDKVLLQMADFYDNEVERAVKSLTSVIEPIIIAVLAGVIGTIVAAVFMPMFDLVNVVQ